MALRPFVPRRLQNCPLAMARFTKACTESSSGAGHGEPRRGLYGMTFSEQRSGLRSAHTSSQCSGASFTPGISTYSTQMAALGRLGNARSAAIRRSIGSARLIGMISERMRSLGAFRLTARFSRWNPGCSRNSP